MKTREYRFLAQKTLFFCGWLYDALSIVKRENSTMRCPLKLYDALSHRNYAIQHGMSIRAQHLLWGGGEPSYFANANFTPDEWSKILEFAVKTKVIKYKRVIQKWDSADEAASEILYGDSKWRFWYNRLGENIIYDVAKWTLQANPDAKLVVVEDHVLETSFLQPQLRDKFIAILKEFKARNIPLYGVGIENNFWIYDPPNKDGMSQVLKTIKALGFDIATSEITVAISPVFPSWESRPKKLQTVSNSIEAQAQIFQDTFETYFALGAREIGLSGWSDKYSWHNAIGHPEARAMLKDENNNSKLAYYTVQRILFQELARKK